MHRVLYLLHNIQILSWYCAKFVYYLILEHISLCVFAIIEKGELVGNVRTLTSHTLQFRWCQTTLSFHTRYVDLFVAMSFRVLGCEACQGSQESLTRHL